MKSFNNFFVEARTKAGLDAEKKGLIHTGKGYYADGSGNIVAKAENGERLVVETTTSWCFVGAGLRLSMELFGPEYSMFVNTLDSDLKLFFSRNVTGAEGEDLVEKQNAESGEMPVVSSETDTYGYTEENRHMVQSFLSGKRPEENFSDGVNVTELLMTAYMSAEKEKTIAFPPPGLDDFIPAVAKGEWNPKND